MAGSQSRGFTLIELLIVVAIIGIIAALAIPNLLVALHKSRQAATMNDIRTIGMGVSAYVVDHAGVPELDGPVADLTPWFNNYYLKTFPHKDSWGGTMYYAGAGLTYSISSLGRDRSIGPAPPTDLYSVNSLEDFNFDIVFSNGTFTRSPRVKSGH